MSRRNRETTIMKIRMLPIGVALLALVTVSQDAQAFYNPSTGRWLSRDPIQEHGGLNLHEFAVNSPVNRFDHLGQIAKGGEVLMNCRQPCEDYRNNILQGDRKASFSSGGIVCCGGIKFVCTWGADNVQNQRAKEIVKRCLMAHEKEHLGSMKCDACRKDIYRPGFIIPRRAQCEEEMNAYTIGKECFEAGKSECGTDQECIKVMEDWAKHEEEGYNINKRQCEGLP